MVSFYFIAAIWPISASFALPCAEQPSAPGMTCHNLPHSDGVSGGILVNDKLRLRDPTDVHSTTAITVTPRDGDPRYFHRADGDMNECGTTIFYAYEYAQPPRSDCEAVENWARNNKGVWTLGEGDQPIYPSAACLVQSGSCAFCMIMNPETLYTGVSIGNQDVADLVHYAIYVDDTDPDGNGDTVGIRGFSSCNTPSRDNNTITFWVVTPDQAKDLPELHGYPQQ
ncbi:hypothetical protein F4818DRAFT_452234 [Hypoxylon cercidicola]|nr:hypothetical protein F4818DRAFT_452234 [Hypoxylon cercidicola]